MSTFTTTNATQGRLAPGHLRDAFEEMVETGQIPDGATQYGAPLNVQMLTGLLLNCDDIMPRQLCDLLDVPQGRSYAQGSRAYRAAEAAALGDDRANRFFRVAKAEPAPLSAPTSFGVVKPEAQHSDPMSFRVVKD